MCVVGIAAKDLSLTTLGRPSCLIIRCQKLLTLCPWTLSEHNNLFVLQEAAAKDASKSSWQLRLQCVLAAASLQLPPPLPPAVLSDTVQPQHAPDSPQTATQHARDTGIAASDTAPSEAATDTSPKAKVTSFSLSQDTYAAVTALNKALAGNLPAWLKELQAGSRQADALSRLLASVQWQLAGAIERLYIMLQSSAAAQSPSHPNLNIKVPAHSILSAAYHPIAVHYVAC